MRLCVHVQQGFQQLHSQREPLNVRRVIKRTREVSVAGVPSMGEKMGEQDVDDPDDPQDCEHSFGSFHGREVYHTIGAL